MFSFLHYQFKFLPTNGVGHKWRPTSTGIFQTPFPLPIWSLISVWITIPPQTQLNPSKNWTSLFNDPNIITISIHKLIFHTNDWDKYSANYYMVSGQIIGLFVVLFLYSLIKCRWMAPLTMLSAFWFRKIYFLCIFFARWKWGLMNGLSER